MEDLEQALYQGSALSLSYMSAPETVETVGLTEWGGGASPFSFKYHEIPGLLHGISMC